MYINQLFSDFHTSISSYINNNHITPVDDINQICESKYFQQGLKSSSLSIFNFSSDPFVFIKYFFKLNDSVIDELREVISLVDTFFQTKNTKKPNFHSNENDFTILKSSGLERDGNSVSFLFCRANVILKITEKKGLVFGDLAMFVDQTYTPIDEENDISKALSVSINLFKQHMLKVFDNNNFLFGHDFMQQFKEVPLEDMIQKRLKLDALYNGFTFRTRDSLLDELKLLKVKYPSGGVSLCPDGMVFNNNDIPFFLHAMKSMFPSSVYSNIERAINFYHNYNVFMNYEYDIEVKFYIKNKLDNIDKIMSVSFDDIVFDVALKNNQYEINQLNDKDRKTLFEIYTQKYNDTAKKKIIPTVDLSELYNYLFKKYSLNISKTLEKSVDKMTLDDGKVLLMYNF